MKILYNTGMIKLGICIQKASLMMVGIGALSSALCTHAYAQAPYTLPDEYIQLEIIRNQGIAESSYQSWLFRAHRAAQRKDMNFSFEQLLDSYAGGPNYDPLATDTIDGLYALAYEVENAKSSENADEAAQKFRLTLERHAPNYDVVTAAIPLVRDNPYLGDLDFLQWVRAGLQKRLLQSVNNGAVASSAYNIYVPGEETFLLRQRNIKLIKTEVLATNTEYYHIHLVEDAKSGKPSKIYMRLSDIMRRMESQERLKNPSYKFAINPPANFMENAQDRTK